MKTGAAILFAIFASASAFTPPLVATRAVAAPKKAAAKAGTKVVGKAKKPVAAKKIVAAKPAVDFKSLFAKKTAKPVAAKPVAAKSASKKIVAKKPVGKKAAATKTVAQKPVAKKAPAFDFFAKKAPAPAASKKVVAKKAVAKKAVAKKPIAKKVFAKKPVAKKAVAKSVVQKRNPGDFAYPSISNAAGNFKLGSISGGGNKAPGSIWTVPDFSDPKLQIKRDPKFYAEAAKTRLNKAKQDFVYDDGLTVIERKQKGSQAIFLSGSARSQIDKDSIVGEIDGVDYFGLSADRFQLLMISIFGALTLFGCLTGNLQL